MDAFVNNTMRNKKLEVLNFVLSLWILEQLVVLTARVEGKGQMADT